MHKISDKLPYDLIRYIFEINAARIIQNIWRKNRPNINLKIGSRVLVMWNSHNKIGTIERMGLNYGYNYKYRIKLISLPHLPKRIYIYNTPSLNQPKKIIPLRPWNIKEDILMHFTY